MCTVTFVARQNGYALGMNRDEKLSRAPGLPPGLMNVGGRGVLCPSEPGGGTWIAVNDRGATLALINWYSVAARVGRNSVSRGEVVKAAAAAVSPEAVQAALNRLPLKRINPFRLIGAFPRTREIVEWRWNLSQLLRRKHRWKTQQWASSGFDEPKAQRVRGRTFQTALRHPLAGRLDWLRRLHCSHEPEVGPFSMCMHRADAATVSYTEVTVSTNAATMHHHPGAPCKSAPRFHERLRLKPNFNAPSG